MENLASQDISASGVSALPPSRSMVIGAIAGALHGRDRNFEHQARRIVIAVRRVAGLIAGQRDDAQQGLPRNGRVGLRKEMYGLLARRSGRRERGRARRPAARSARRDTAASVLPQRVRTASCGGSRDSAAPGTSSGPDGRCLQRRPRVVCPCAAGKLPLQVRWARAPATSSPRRDRAASALSALRRGAAASAAPARCLRSFPGRANSSRLGATR